MSTALLLSGGMDSISIAYWKRPELAITLDYGQLPAAAEIQASAEVCRELAIQHEVVAVDCSSIGSGDLVGTQAISVAPASDWWPFRNQLLVTLAAARAVALGSRQLLLGCVASDSCHKDGTSSFIETLSSLLAMQEGSLQLEAPAIGLTTAELVCCSKVPPEILAWAHSCHVSNLACGRCRGCAKHFETMTELNVRPY